MRAVRLAHVVALAALCGTAAAHGGQYRGMPGATPAQPNPFATPGYTPPNHVGGPDTPRVEMPRPEENSWQYWWFYNRDEFLARRPATPYVAAHPQDAQTDATNAARRHSSVVAWLHRQLRTETHRDVHTSCLVALAKIGEDHEQFELVPLIRSFLREETQQTRETAALALGMTHRPEVVPLLAELVSDSGAGQRLVDRARVGDRTRAFALYGLALVGAAHEDLAVKESVWEIVSEVLADPGGKDYEILVAAVKAAGALRPDVRVRGHKRLLWRMLPELHRFSDRKFRGDQADLSQAHVPSAVATLLGRGHTPEHQRFKERCREALTRGKRDVRIGQAMVLSLGRVAEASEVHEADAAYSDLLQAIYKRHDDRLIRLFALIALGQIGGDSNREFLLKRLPRASKSIEKPWLALALGVIAHSSRQDGEVDVTIGRALLDEFRKLKSPEAAAAIVIALGLSGYAQASAEIRRALEKRGDDVLIAHGEVGCALMGERLGLGTLEMWRPLVSTETAIARAAVGDRGIREALDRLVTNAHPAATSVIAVAAAYRLVDDRRPMAVIADKTKVGESFRIALIAIAQGMLADKDPTAWNRVFATGTNYAARVPTLEDGQAGILDIL